MTFTAYAVMSIVMFFLFLAWYQFVHRNGESTPQGLEDTRVIGMNRRHLQGLAMETGEIGERDEEDADEDREEKGDFRFASDRGYMTEFGETFADFEPDDQSYRLFPDRERTRSASSSNVNPGRMEGIFPPPDVEFATMPTAHFQNLDNQLPVPDDTVMFKEGNCDEKQ